MGLVALTWAADRFVTGAASIARDLGVSMLVIGITIVGFGTSAPEMLVSLVASLEGSASIGIGNAIGSNITNTTLILGVTGLVAPFAVNRRVLTHEIPKLLGFTLIAAALVWDGTLGRVDGAVLFALFIVAVLVPLVSSGRKDGADLEAEVAREVAEPLPMKSAIVWTVVGLLALLGSSWVLVWGASTGARALGVSELVIGLTIVAAGTSLPELAASVAAARRGEFDIAVGNVFGSNVFNILAVLAMPGLAAPGPTPDALLRRDMTILVAVTLLFAALVFAGKRPLGMRRGGALVLLAAYVAYTAYLFVA